MELFTGRVCLRLIKSPGLFPRSLARFQAPFSCCERRLCLEGPRRGITLFETHSRLSLGKFIYKADKPNAHNLRPQCRPYSDKTNKADGGQAPLQKPNIFQKMKQMTKDYWHVLIPVHVVTSLGWVLILYTAAKNSVDVIWILEKLHVSEKYIEALRGSSAGLWAVTYALYKICTPARYMVTVGGTTLSIKYLSRMGYVKTKLKTPSVQKSNQGSIGKSGTKDGQSQAEPPKT